MTSEQTQRMSEAVPPIETKRGLSRMHASFHPSSLNAERCKNALNYIAYLESDLTAAREQLAEAREALPKWIPASEHPGLFEDGEAYLVRVPVLNQRYSREFMEYHIITASCDSETPVTFNDQNGDHWCAWDWEDVEAYIKFDTLARLTQPKPDAGRGGHHD